MMTRTTALIVAALAAAGVGAFELRDDGVLRAAYRYARGEYSDWRLSRTLSTVDCPREAFVILAIGQSNAANHLGTKVEPIQGDRTFASFRGKCTLLGDPVPGATGDMGSLWPTLARKVSLESGGAVVVIAGAVGGSRAQDWRDDVRRMRSRVAHSVEAAIAANLSPDAIIWIQGESDALTTSSGAYEEQVGEVITAIERAITSSQARAGGKPKRPHWIITLTSRCDEESPTGSEAVREGQRRVAAKIENVHIGPDTDVLGNEFRRDGCHFNDAGRTIVTDQFAAMLARKIAIIR